MVSEKYILSRATKVDRFYDLVFILKPVLMLCIYIYTYIYTYIHTYIYLYIYKAVRNPPNIASGFLFKEDYIGFLFSSS